MSKRLALVVGNSRYDDPTLTKLKTPKADAAALASVLGDPHIGGFDEVLELVDPTEAEARRAIGDFFRRRHPRDLLLFYFSGHGVKDDRGRLYLALRDTEYERLSTTAIASAFLVEHMDDCRSRRQVIILDCCNSGAFARGSKGDPTAYTADTFAGSGFGRVVLTASDSTQYALEGDQVIERAELSLFTHYLLEGLKTGQAAPGQPWITLDALYDYTYGRVVSHARGQTPRKWVYNQEGSVVVARNPLLTDATTPFPDPQPSVARPAAPGPRRSGEGVGGIDIAEVLPAARGLVERGRDQIETWAADKPPPVVWIAATVVAFALAGLFNGGIRLALVGFIPRLVAGVVEGALLGSLQAWGLRRSGRSVPFRRWIQWTLGAVVLRWQFPLPGFPTAGTGAVLIRGVLDGLLVGGAQSQGASMVGRSRLVWIVANVAGWTLAYLLFQPIFLVLVPSMAAAPGLSAMVVGCATGVCVGGATAFALGAFTGDPVEGED